MSGPWWCCPGATPHEQPQRLVCGTCHDERVRSLEDRLALAMEALREIAEVRVRHTQGVAVYDPQYFAKEALQRLDADKGATRDE